MARARWCGRCATVPARRRVPGRRVRAVVGARAAGARVRALAVAAGMGDLTERQLNDRFALATSLLDAIRGRGRAVAVVEDAQWADPGTLDVIRLLARRVEDAAVVIVVTYRDDELAANTALAALVGDLATDRRVRRVRSRTWPDLPGASARCSPTSRAVRQTERSRTRSICRSGRWPITSRRSSPSSVRPRARLRCRQLTAAACSRKMGNRGIKHRPIVRCPGARALLVSPSIDG